MGIFEYLLGPKDSEPDDVQPAQPRAGTGPDVNQGRKKTKTEKDLRRVQSTHEPEWDRFEGRGKR